MIKDMYYISLEDERMRGCGGCIHHKFYPEQLYDECDLPYNECTHGDD